MGKHKNIFKVLCPNNNHSERIYIISLLLEDYLGIRCDISFENKISDYNLIFDNRRIIIEDHFFNYYTEELSYLTLESIPESYSILKSKNLPIIYGRDLIKFNVNEIYCGIDIFASSFFLLTRWEEFILPKRKDGLRCDEYDLFLIKHKLYKRPLVNEYLDILSSFFSYFHVNVNITRKFNIFQTHDVDWLYLSTYKDLSINLKKLISSQKLYKKAFVSFFSYLYYRLNAMNPFDSFDDFMQFSEVVGLKNHFYFKMCDKNEKGSTYHFDDRRTKDTIISIIDRGHYIGFHPSENCTNNSTQFNLELKRLLEIAPNAKGGRQHHLIYQSDTLKTWNNNNLAYDSGYGFQEHNGFRCGICYDFPVFDVYSREKLNLYEIPYVLMDTVFLRNRSTITEMLKEAKEIIDTVKKHNGTLCTVWHTNLFKTLERKKYINTYFELIKYAVNEQQ